MPRTPNVSSVIETTRRWLIGPPWRGHDAPQVMLSITAGDLESDEGSRESRGRPRVIDLLVRGTPGQSLLGALASALGPGAVDFPRKLGAVDEDDDLVVAHLAEAAGYRGMMLLAALAIGQLADPERREKRGVPWEDAEVALDARHDDLVDLLGDDEPRGCRHLQRDAIGHLGLSDLLGLLARLADVADHVERLLGQLVVLTIDDFPEALHGVGHLHVAPGQARELLGHEHRLRQESLDFTRAGHGGLVLVGQLFHAEDRDDVLEIFVALQDRLYGARGLIVLLADDVRVEDA